MPAYINHDELSKQSVAYKNQLLMLVYFLDKCKQFNMQSDFSRVDQSTNLLFSNLSNYDQMTSKYRLCSYMSGCLITDYHMLSFIIALLFYLTSSVSIFAHRCKFRQCLLHKFEVNKNKRRHHLLQRYARLFRYETPGFFPKHKKNKNKKIKIVKYQQLGILQSSLFSKKKIRRVFRIRLGRATALCAPEGNLEFTFHFLIFSIVNYNWSQWNVY